MKSPHYLTLIKCYDFLDTIKGSDHSAPAYMLRVDIGCDLGEAMEAEEFQEYLEQTWAEDSDLGGRCLDDDQPDAVQEWMGDLDFAERLEHFTNFLS